MSSTGAAHADSGPSFNCQKATSPVEHTICADAVLAKLDRQLALAWKALLTEFNDEHQIAAIRADQNRWLTSRNTCGANASCLQTAYGKRLSQIGGGDAAVPAAGVFEAAQIGKFALYPIGPGYLIYIQTADPNAGLWTCEIIGEAKTQGEFVRVQADGISFSARLANDHILVVEPNEEVYGIERGDCGLNGSIAFTYTRSRT